METPTFSPRGKKWLLAGAIFLFVNGFFVAKVPQATRPELAGVSALFVLVLAAPSFWALGRWLGWKRAVAILLALGAFAVGIETLAVKTGLPYGEFAYGDKIGVKFFGLVPWTVPFAWSPLVLGAAALARNRAPLAFIAALTAWLVAFDLVLDPGAVQQKFWSYPAGGWYYNVPFSNYVGWVISGLIGGAIFYLLAGKRTDAPLTLVSSVAMILAFWTSIALFTNMWIPALIGFALLAWTGKEISHR